MQVRILGIAPIVEVYGEQGEFRYEKPLFWVYYPELRPLLARHTVFIPGNDREVLSWADIFDRRCFSSVIIKEQNRRDSRIQDYLSGMDQLPEAKQIEEALFNFEQDLWSY
jgi:gliding motility associated protien GldN